MDFVHQSYSNAYFDAIVVGIELLGDATHYEVEYRQHGDPPKSLEITLPNIGDLVEIIMADDGQLVGRRGSVVRAIPDELLYPYFAIDIVGLRENVYFTADYLQVIETAQQRAEKILSEEYFS